MSKTKKYDWSDPDNLPTLEAHSITKHEVLQAYLHRYLEVLNIDPRIPSFKIYLIDGFCGGGQYVNELTNKLQSGSPAIILDTVRDAEALINLKRDKEFKIHAKYFFVDTNPHAIRFLKEHLISNGYKDRAQDMTFINGLFAERANDIIRNIEAKSKNSRAIFILDQYGYKDVPLHIIRDIFRKLPNAEIILTIATDWIIDYINDSDKSKFLIKKIGLNQLSKLSIEDTKKQADWRMYIQKHLSDSFKNDSGALFYTPFFIKSNNCNRSYWLVHLSMHEKARNEMMQVHWKLQNHFIHHGGSGLNMLGYNPDDDERVTGQVPMFVFDNVAKDQSLKSLELDLPSWIHKEGGDVTFRNIIKQTFNTSPASDEMYKEVLFKLSKYGELEIKTPKGSNRRVSLQISPNDNIRLKKQTQFYFMKPDKA
ncbi:MAG: hypothetical protein COB46_05245 [Rhodospirillaceae bacterium]|nr:MAG: hypothetical protein COB46_05245 [Rhodospirillaceae bacterium]